MIAIAESRHAGILAQRHVRKLGPREAPSQHPSAAAGQGGGHRPAAHLWGWNVTGTRGLLHLRAFGLDGGHETR